MRSPLTRYEGNPILTPEMMPFPCYTVMNAGVTRFEGDVLLMLRVESCERMTKFYIARSKDGIHFDVNPEPINYEFPDAELFGTNMFDTRITEMDGVYYIFHARWTRLGCMINLATTTDFVNYKKIYHSLPANRNAVLFPEKINGNYARLERPQDINGSGRIWYSESPDLQYWGNSMPVDLPILSWSERKSGPGAIPVKTKEGWLEIYHATCFTASTENYYLGVCLLDLEQPWKIISAPKSFILAPEKAYECMGQTPNVVFAGGGCLMDDDTYYLYYGGADTRMCLAKTSITELLEFCRKGK